mmetsp:Transcript_5356/g.10340  ORF Transcript_5356/g.10340 Transcript_5356/m.10340 type:complete len:431 (+) Transcript_5356:264-1556(+)
MKRKRDTVCVAFLSLATPMISLPMTTAFQPAPGGGHGGLNRFRLHPLSMSALPGTPMNAARSVKPLIEVSLDRPLLTDMFIGEATKKTTGPNLLARIWQTVTGAVSGVGGSGLLSSNVVRVAVIAFLIAFAATMLFRLPGGMAQSLSKFFKTLNGRIERFVERVKPDEEGIPMPFEEGNEGWGVSTLRSRKRLGKTNFIQYEFELPEPDYVLPLELGQQVSLCCLDNEGNVARGDFFPFSPTGKTKPGSFSVLVPNKTPEENIVLLGLEAANFCRVVKQELKIGDEVAIKPGDTRLNYRGQYLPVTDILYVACGNGIVPVLEQARAVLPRGSSSVAAVTVVWINEETKDFDVLAEVLEKEYFKYSDKLAVSCIVDSPRRRDWSDNNEINAAVPDFKQGTMAVLAGPTDLMEKAFYYLEDRGYPSDTICVL